MADASPSPANTQGTSSDGIPGPDDLSGLFAAIEWYGVIRIALIVLAIFLLPLLTRRLRTWASRRWSDQVGQLSARATLYGGLLLLLFTLLSELGFEITPMLGALGLFGVAIGLASQTSFSNIISGLFLISERSFKIGDVLKLGDTVGIVHSVDLLSIKLRTFDNHLIRIPNETLIKSTVRNITHFPIRRIDITVSVAYKEDVAKVRAALKEIAREHPLVLDEPEPLVVFTNFGDSGLEFLFGLWITGSDYLAVKNGMMDAIKARFDADGIEIPFPHVTLYTGAATEPFPLTQIQGPPPSLSS